MKTKEEALELARTIQEETDAILGAHYFGDANDEPDAQDNQDIENDVRSEKQAFREIALGYYLQLIHTLLESFD